MANNTASLYAELRSAAQVARQLGCSERTVLTDLRSAGVDINSPGNRFGLTQSGLSD